MNNFIRVFSPLMISFIYAGNTSICSTAELDHGGVNPRNYLYVLLLGQALNGFAGTCYYSIGITFLDESVSTKSSPLYLGVLRATT